MIKSAAQKVQAETQKLVQNNEAEINKSSTTENNLDAEELRSAGISKELIQCLQELVKVEDNGEDPEDFNKFQAELRKFISTCIKYRASYSTLHDYQKAIKEMATSKSNSKSKDGDKDLNNGESETESELEKLVKSTREKFHNSDYVKETLQKAKNCETNDANEKYAPDFESQNLLPIQKEFPKRMQNFRHLGSLLRGADSRRNSKVIEHISKILGVDFDDFKQVIFSKDVVSYEEQIQNMTSQIDLESVKEKLPPLKNLPVDFDIKSSHQILTELELESESPQEKSLKLKELKTKYEEILKFFEKWANKNADDIYKWAKSQRGSKGHLNISEAVAVADRANQLVTGGHRLRIPQIISLLVFLQDSSASPSTGQLCQIQAGEGKTAIAAVLAVIKILQGEFSSVDVITSNQVLAEEAVREKSSFYHLFGITVTTNNNSEKDEDENRLVGSEEGRQCYGKQVVYGSIGNFQFDFLRDERGHRGDAKNKEKFGYLILDEVDSMTIDGGGHLAKISTPLPGMEALKYFYIQIWHDIFPAAESELQKELQAKFETTDDEDEKLSLILKVNTRLKEIMLEGFQNCMEKNPVVCDHLKEFAKSSMEKWIDNAIYAKYGCSPNREYCITEIQVDNPMEGQPKSEKKVVPIDYANTGVSMKDTIWSSGLHQFVQLKHDLRLTSESLTSCCISNYGYIKLYPWVSGMTGTLGSSPERELLKTMYSVQFAHIPTFKPRKFKQLPGILVGNDLWTVAIAKETVSMAISSGRAVLIISQTIADSLEISECLEDEQVLEFLQDTSNSQDCSKMARSPKIKKFYTQDDSGVLRDPLNPGDVVIATNIAGRGADFLCTAKLQKNGGLHVILTFYPDNERVKDQAVFRTSRQGQSGSARVILKKSDVQELGLSSLVASISLCGVISSDNLMTEVAHVKQQVEKERIDLLKKVKVAQLFYEDILHSKFRQFCLDNFSSSFSAEHYVLKDFKEFWAFWLEKQQQKWAKRGWGTGAENSDEVTTDVTDWESKLGEKATIEFQNFLEDPKCQTIVKDKLISHNPYYGIQQAEFFLQDGEKLKEAKASLENAISIKKTPQILYSAYVKLFEIAMEEGGALLEKFKDTMAKVAIFGYFINVKDEKYKENALPYLKKAEEALQVEINFLKSFVSQPEPTTSSSPSSIFPSGSDSNSMGNSRVSTTKVPIMKGDEKIENISDVSEDKSNLSSFNDHCEKHGHLNPNSNQGKINHFTNHLQSRLLSLNVHHQNLSSLKKQIEDSINGHGLVVRSRVSNYFETLQPKTEDEENLKKSIFPAETSELHQIGLETLYSLGQVHDAPTEVVAAAQGQIIAGLAALAVGLAFPPVIPITGPIAGALIAEGILDVVQEILNYNRDTGFDLKSYTIDKAISYGISICTMGFGAIASCTKILATAAKACRGLASLLRKCPFMKSLCRALARGLEKMATYFEKLVQASLKTQKMSRAAFVKSVGKSTVENVTTSLFMQHVVSPGIDQVLSSLKPEIKKNVETAILTKMREDAETLKILEHMKREQVLTVSFQILCETSICQDVSHVAKEISLGVAKSSKSWKVKLAASVIDTIITCVELDRRVGWNFCEKLSDKLKEMKNNGSLESEPKNKEQVEMLLLKISELVTDKIYSTVLQMSGKLAQTFVVNPLVNKLKNSLSSQKPSNALTNSNSNQHENEHDLAMESSSDRKRARREALAILELPNGASDSQIDKKYKIMALKSHPDRPNGSEASFKKVGAAKEFLLGETSAQSFFSASVNTPQNSSASSFSDHSTSGSSGAASTSVSFPAFASSSSFTSNSNSNPILNSFVASSNLKCLQDMFKCAPLNVAHHFFGFRECDLAQVSRVVNSGRGSALPDIERMVQWTKMNMVTSHFEVKPGELDFHRLLTSGNTDRAIICFPAPNSASASTTSTNETRMGHVVILKKCPDSGVLEIWDSTTQPPTRQNLSLFLQSLDSSQLTDLKTLTCTDLLGAQTLEVTRQPHLNLNEGSEFESPLVFTNTTADDNHNDNSNGNNEIYGAGKKKLEDWGKRLNSPLPTEATSLDPGPSSITTSDQSNSAWTRKPDPRGGADYGNKKLQKKEKSGRQLERQNLKGTTPAENTTATSRTNHNTRRQDVGHQPDPDNYNPKNENISGGYPGGVAIGGDHEEKYLDEFRQAVDLIFAKIDKSKAPVDHRKEKAKNKGITRSDIKNGDPEENIDRRLEHPRNGAMTGSIKHSKTPPGPSKDVALTMTRTGNKGEDPVSELMIGILTAKAIDGQTITFVAASGPILNDRETLMQSTSKTQTVEPLPMKWKKDGVTFVNIQVKDEPIVNVLTGKASPVERCTTNCAAQKLFSALAEYVLEKENPKFIIGKASDISMIETWYKKPGTSGENRNWHTTQAVNSCDKCCNTLPHFLSDKS